MVEQFGRNLRALVVDDTPSMLTLLTRLLESHGFQVVTADTLKGGFIAYDTHRPDLAIIDKHLPDGTGLKLAAYIYSGKNDSEVVIMTAHADLGSTVEAIRLKVADYLLKPFDDLTLVSHRLGQVVSSLRLRRHNRELLEHLTQHKHHLERLTDELQRKNDVLTALAVRDGLTGLFNHAYFYDRLSRELSRSRRAGAPLGVLFIDVDNFKGVNDAQGHPAGDQLLRHLSELFTQQTRASDIGFRLDQESDPSDVAARYGGDEFVLILPETPSNGVATKAERLRERVAQGIDPGLPHITISVGTATFPDDAGDRDGLIKAADLALYAAKASGKNRVVAYGPQLRTLAHQFMHGGGETIV